MTSTAPPASTTGAPARLSGKLGAGSIVFMVVAAAAPLTVVAGVVPAGILLGNGPAFPATYIVTTIVLLLFAVGFTAMARHTRSGGAFYTFIARGLGRRVGTGSALLALLTYATVQLAVWGYIGAAVADLITSHGGPDIPWWIWSLACQAIVAWLGYRNIDLSGKVLGLLLIAEVAVVLVIDAFVIGSGGTDEGLSTAMFQPSLFAEGSPGIALTFAVAGYIGFEATAIFRDEARDPDRTIPRATYLALILIGVFYAFASWAFVSAFGDDSVVAALTDGATIVDVAAAYTGPIVADVVQVLLVTSLFAAALSFHNILARYIHALGGSEVLPQATGRTHARHLSPHVASNIQAVVSLVLLGACAIAGLDPVAQIFTWFAGVASVGVIVLMLLTSAAVIVYFAGRRSTGRWHAVVAPLLGGLGLLAFLVLTLVNLPLLVGGSEVLAWIIVGALIAAFAGGVILAHLRPRAARNILEELA